MPYKQSYNSYMCAHLQIQHWQLDLSSMGLFIVIMSSWSISLKWCGVCTIQYNYWWYLLNPCAREIKRYIALLWHIGPILLEIFPSRRQNTARTVLGFFLYSTGNGSGFMSASTWRIGYWFDLFHSIRPCTQECIRVWES